MAEGACSLGWAGLGWAGLGGDEGVGVIGILSHPPEGGRYGATTREALECMQWYCMYISTFEWISNMLPVCSKLHPRCPTRLPTVAAGPTRALTCLDLRLLNLSMCTLCGNCEHGT